MAHVFAKGVYRISRWGSHERPEILTALKDGDVTVAPPGVHPSKDQEWFVELLDNGNVAIQHPADRWPSRSLSYNEPKEGEKIILGPARDFPTREWRLEPAREIPFPNPYFIRVPDKELIVILSGIFIEPRSSNLGLLKVPS